MSVYAISDLHLATDPEIRDKSMDVFGGAWVGHAERLRSNWMNMVSDRDTVLIPGDVSWGLKLEEACADLAWIDSLPGKKIISKGNHDLWWSSLKKMQGMYDSISFLHNNGYVGEEFAVFGSRGWTLPGDRDFKESEDRKIFNREVIRLRLSYDSIRESVEAARASGRQMKLVAMMHYPPLLSGAETEIACFLSEIGTDITIYGHLHGGAAASGFSGNVGGVEYRLVSLDALGAVPLRLF